MSYFDYILEIEDIRPDLHKLQGNLTENSKTSQKELETNLGVMTYLPKLLPRVVDITVPSYRGTVERP